MTNLYESYYARQAGGGVSHVYAGAPFQKGYGVGSFLRGMFRGLIPFLKSAGKNAAGEALQAGVNVLNDVTSGRTPLRDSVKRHAEEAGSRIVANLKRKAGQIQNGSGYKKKRPTKKPQSRRTARRVNFKQSLTKADLFTPRRK